MGAVDTTYTFTATDTITSAKMNNIIDQTTITTDAIIGTTLDVASGKLKIRSAGITSNEMGANSVVTVAITDANVTQAKLASNVAGNGPIVIANRITTNQLLNSASLGTVKVLFNNIPTDTNGNFSNSRFTATVAGYYLFIGSVYVVNPTNLQTGLAELRSGAGSPPTRVFCGNYFAPNSTNATVSVATGIRYMAVGDWMEMWVNYNSGNTSSYVGFGEDLTYFNASLIRSA